MHRTHQAHVAELLCCKGKWNSEGSPALAIDEVALSPAFVILFGLCGPLPCNGIMLADL